MILYERASQEEQNGVNFSFVAPSSEELLADTCFPIQCTCMVKVVTTVSPKTLIPKGTDINVFPSSCLINVHSSCGLAEELEGGSGKAKPATSSCGSVSA